MSARDVLVTELDEQQGLYAPELRADAILSALTAAGYAVVPVKATRGIREALMKWAHPDEQWRDALTAAQEPTP